MQLFKAIALQFGSAAVAGIRTTAVCVCVAMPAQTSTFRV